MVIITNQKTNSEEKVKIMKVAIKSKTDKREKRQVGRRFLKSSLLSLNRQLPTANCDLLDCELELQVKSCELH